MKVLLLVLAGLCTIPALAQNLNGFDLTNSCIPINQVLRGGPPKDGIPSIDNPVFDSVSEQREFVNSDQVLGVYYNGVAKAYPIKIMDWHEVVNDEFAGKPVVITYCPLCGSGIAFDANLNQPTEFGVSGLLYNSDVLLYDRTSYSLWSQIMAKAVSGPMKGRELVPLSTWRMTLGSWEKLHPETLLLSTDTGFDRDYQITPYGGYEQEDRTYFPLTNEDNTFHKKEWVIGVKINGAAKAYPIKSLTRLKNRMLQDEINGTSIVLNWDNKGQNVSIKTSNGKEIVSFQMFWFAWAAFHPDTEVFEK